MQPKGYNSTPSRSRYAARLCSAARAITDLPASDECSFLQPSALPVVFLNAQVKKDKRHEMPCQSENSVLHTRTHKKALTAHHFNIWNEKTKMGRKKKLIS